jgi:hypothetical protein
MFDTCNSLSFLKETNTWSAGQHVSGKIHLTLVPVTGSDLPGTNRVFEFVLCLEMDLSAGLLELEEFLGRTVCEVCSEFLPLKSSRPLLDLEVRRGTGTLTGMPFSVRRAVGMWPFFSALLYGTWSFVVFVFREKCFGRGIGVAS